MTTLKRVFPCLPILFLTLFTAICAGQELPVAHSARTVPISGDGYAGSSVNVLAGVRQTLFTDGIYQYTAFYNSAGKLVLGKRRLGLDTWELKETPFSGHVQDAHNHISLAVDGKGFLHLAWDHHNSPLQYARGDAPGSLVLQKKPVVGTREDRVTYPQFYRLKNGNLLLQYRDGGSGNGGLLLDLYRPEGQTWERLHDILIDGEGQRSAYWDMAVDPNGVLHLAWNWRENPDVASNHDIAYARSQDDGRTWETLSGDPLALPLTAGNAPVVWEIPRRHKLMNPPAVGADWHSVPFISAYWADGPEEKPLRRVLFPQGGLWREIRGPQPPQNFELSGGGTKRPPWSRAALLVESDWGGSRLHLIYRDDFRAGKVIAASVNSLAQPQWEERILVSETVGAWEPAFDPEQWRRLKQAHLLLQRVEQRDGDDQQGMDVPPAPVNLLVWSPVWERHQDLQPSPTPPVPPGLDRPLSAEAIADVARKAARWHWEHLPENGGHYHMRGWTQAPLYIGTLALADVLGDRLLESLVLRQSEALGWQPHRRLYDADDHCVIQPYLSLYLKYREPAMLAPSQARLDSILANPSPYPLDWGYSHSRNRWSWCDALFMGPMSWLLMYEATGDSAYLDFMNREWWATSDRLYRPDIGLFFRDESWMDLREQNGKTIHWARGNGWSVAGLAQVLAHLPKTHPDYPRYLRQFREMAATLLKIQQPDGLWRPGLLDPDTHTAWETSGSSFYVFALAWGIRNGLLDADAYQPAVLRGWNALVNCITDQGKLENVQPIGAAPHGFQADHSEPFATGAFLLAASEVYQLAGGR